MIFTCLFISLFTQGLTLCVDQARPDLQQSCICLPIAWITSVYHHKAVIYLCNCLGAYQTNLLTEIFVTMVYEIVS